MAAAAEIIAALELAPHPEGGWCRETWVAPPHIAGGRSAATSILFRREAGQRSHCRRVDAAELWLFHAGAPRTLATAEGERGERDQRTVRLRADPLAGCVQQHLVRPGEWQAAQAPDEGWSLAACVVAPGFRFEGFELAPPDWRPAS